jgi:hypothetical protein
MELRHADEWSGEHRGVSFTIKHWGIDPKHSPLGIWNYYLHIPLDAIPEDKQHDFLANPKKDDKGRVHYEYYDKHLINELEWHCGMTFYQKHGMDGAPIVIEMGCDYNHSWDLARDFSLEEILHDCQNSIDRLWRLVPNIKRRCHTVGGFHDLSDGVLHGDSFISFDGIRWRRRHYPDSELYKDVVLPDKKLEGVDG